MIYRLRQNPAHPNNFTVGRQGNKANKIVIHHAATTDFDGIARTFQNPNRAASAHYGVGRDGNVDQYVQESNTAWHCGNWQGNLTSVGIENVNKTGGPDWLIDDSTFNTLVELVADIAHRLGLGKLVVGQNLFGHKDFMATACPAQLYGRLQELANRVNGTSSGNANPAAPAPRKSNEVIADEVMAGAWGNNPERRNKLIANGYDYDAIQAIVNSRMPSGNAAPAPSRPSNDQIADQVIALAWGVNPQRKQRLEAAGYDYNAIQAIVNQKLGYGAAPSAPARKSNEQVANEIIAGTGGWGNNPERRDRLQAQGYDYNAVQAIVNRKLGF